MEEIRRRSGLERVHDEGNNMKKLFLPFSPPMIGKAEIAEVVDTLRSDWITTGPKTEKFEGQFRKYVGAKGALALDSCTAALHLALAASGVGKGDAVITTPMTFCSGVNVIEHTGAQPVLADIDPETMNIDPRQVEKILRSKSMRKKVKAIIPVHFAGRPCDMAPLMRLARKYGIKVIEDAAHALPAKYKGKMIGTIGDLTAFSFYATKNLTTAEGGMLTGRDKKLMERARLLSLHGMSRDAWKRYSAAGSWYYEIIAPGFKYNMTDIQAAIGIHQLRRLGGFQKRRREIAAAYNQAFSKNAAFQIPASRREVQHAWHLYVLRLNLKELKIDRARFIDELKRRGIGASVHFIPVHMHPYYRKKYGFKPADFPVAYREYQRTISLPLYPRMTDADVRRVITAATQIAKRYARGK